MNDQRTPKPPGGMRLFGSIVTPEQIAACEQRMKSGPFRHADIKAVAESVGVSFSHELAARLIGRNKSAGRIILESRKSGIWKPS